MPRRFASFAVCFALWLSGCGEKLADSGSACTATSQCSTHLCYANVCLVPGQDDDGDGLDNATEHALGSHPLKKDSDGDGKADGAEAGNDPAHPTDADGDGLPDLVESAVLDADKDCLADEVDAHNTAPETDAHALAAAGCAHLGVCAAAKGAITATCKTGALACDYHAVAGFSAAELCDGKDNDCDGDVDEGFAYLGSGIGEPCIGVGACGSGIVECRGQKADCSSNPGGSVDSHKAEVCNGLDDDCDGVTDQGFSFGGLPIGSPCLGIGECGLGVVECGGDGKARCSSNPGGSHSHVVQESCNGRDDNCDGVTDDGQFVSGIALGGACVTTGICGSGVVICDSAAPGLPGNGSAVCSSAPGQAGSKAQSEICNGLDDNCNGVTDEGFDFQGFSLGSACPAIGVCGSGTVICSKTGAATCSTHEPIGSSGGEASAEICNGLDDDCDGSTDEQLSWQGSPLGGNCDGVGACGGGIVVCSSSGQATCSSNPDGGKSGAIAELCNGLDDDCDGVTDEDIASVPSDVACSSTGACSVGSPLILCAAGKWQCTFSNPAFQVSETLCDGIDNDCDGLTDEELPLVWGEFIPAFTTRPSARTGIGVTSEGGFLYVIGGLVDVWIPGGGTRASGEIWRLNLQTLAWTLLANQPQLARHAAGAVVLPSPTTPTLVVAGGFDSEGLTAAPLLVDLQTGAPLSPWWKNQPQQRAFPTLVRTNGYVWLLGGDQTGSGVGAQRLDLATGMWSTAVPQPANAVGAVAGCATAAGDLYAYGQDANGSAFFASLPADATAWAALPAVSGKAGAPGRLVCDVAAGEIWLVAGLSESGVVEPSRKYSVSANSWTVVLDSGFGLPPPPVASSWAGGVAAAVGAASGHLVAALGETTQGTGVADAWTGLPGQWTAVDAAPEPAFGARAWALADGGAVRVGGALGRAGAVELASEAWHLQSGQWLKWAPTLKNPRVFPSLLASADGQTLLVWSGLGMPPADGDWLAALANQTPAPGAELLDLATGIWQTAPAALQQILPPLRADSAISRGPVAGQWFVLGADSTTDLPQLWLLDLNKPQKSLLWQGDLLTGPLWHPGSVLVWDPTWSRVIYADPGQNGTLWRYDFGPNEGWSLVQANLGLVAANSAWRLHFLGQSGDPDGVLLAISPQNAPIALRLVLDATVLLTPLPSPKLDLRGAGDVVENQAGTSAWMTEPLDDKGVLQSRWLTVPHACQPPP